MGIASHRGVIGGWWTNAIGGHRGFRAGTREWGKHRTEVTEVTEGNWALVDEFDWVDTGGFRAGARDRDRAR